MILNTEEIPITRNFLYSQVQAQVLALTPITITKPKIKQNNPTTTTKQTKNKLYILSNVKIKILANN